VSRDFLGRRAALSWARDRSLTPQRLWPVLRSRGSLEALFAATEAELSEELGSRERARAVLRAPEDTEALRWAASLERGEMRLVTAFDEEYPRPLGEIPDPPFVLYGMGRLDRLRLPAVAVVGSRDASRYGRDVAWRLASDLSGAGVAVVSGFARGVDASAHEAAAAGPGGTIAVLGCGVDVDYPREHRALKARLKVENLVLSEYPPGTEPRPQNFPIRNRIIAGLCSGVVVVEASRRSGSLITARLAADFGRDVFAVPGSVFSGTSVGAHELLRDGAILCRNAEDVLAELFPSVGPRRGAAASVPSAVELSAESRRVLETLAREESLSAEEIAQALDLPAASVLAGLFELEGAGLAVVTEGGRYGVVRR
jgi:DNA processing protein